MRYYYRKQLQQNDQLSDFQIQVGEEEMLKKKC